MVEKQGSICVLRNNGARLCNKCWRGKAVSITYSDCVFVDLGIQHAMRMHRIILTSLACPVVPYISTLFHSWYDTQKQNFDHKTCVWTFSTYFVCNISHYKKNSARYFHKCI